MEENVEWKKKAREHWKAKMNWEAHQFGRNYDDDVAKKYGFQNQIQGTNPSATPNWSTPLEQGSQMAPSIPFTLAPVPAPVAQPVAGTYIGPHLHAPNQLPRRDKVVQCARGSVCCAMFGIFLVIKGIIMLSIAKNFDVEWTNPPRPSALHIIGPIALSIGIAMLLLTCIVMTAAKSRSAANPEIGVSTPVISGRSDNSDSTFVEVGDHDYYYHNHGSSSHSDNYDSPPPYNTCVTAFSDPSPSSTCDASASSTSDASPSTTTD